MDAFQLRPLPSDGGNTWNTMPGHISYNIADTKTVDKPSPVAKIRYAMSESPAYVSPSIPSPISPITY
jgi:hypothetical protein